MLDHLLGRPSVRFRKVQVFAVVLAWSLYLHKGDRHGPPVLRRISSYLSKRITPWQTMVITLIWLYISRNFGKLVGLECPEPLANLYTRSFFRATWVTTALDAGFWSAMKIRNKPLRDFCSVIFSVYYLICAEQADEKVRKVRSTLTVDHLRVSWDKPVSPYISAFTNLMRPRFVKYNPRRIRIHRPKESAYKEPVHAWLYFDGPTAALKLHDKVVLDVPGGGFVAMNPRCHDDKLLAWAGKTGLPVLSLDYRKAPEFPYPYALNECYDVYHTLVSTRGRCIGLSGEKVPKIIVSGDSAGGNLAVGMVLMVLQSGSTDARRWQGEKQLPPPDGMVLVYPALDMNIGNWMTDEQMALIRERRSRKTNQGVLRQKSEDYRRLTPNTPQPSDDEGENDPSPDRTPKTIPNGFAHGDKNSALASSSTMIKLNSLTKQPNPQPPKPSEDEDFTLSPISPHPSAAHTTSTTQPVTAPSKPRQMRTRLAMSSMISYFNDRILTPEMMRAMIILYIGPYNRPDFSTDYLLSPLLAPESLLNRFPKTYFLTGERDPLVDDTVIFAARIRAAKAGHFREMKELGVVRGEFDPEEWVDVKLVPGISHGFLQFVSVFPEGWKYIFGCAKWMTEHFRALDEREASRREEEMRRETGKGGKGRGRHHFRQVTESSGDEERPLEMSMSSIRGGGVRGGLSRVSSRGSEEVGERVARRRKRPEAKRQKSLVSLASEDDLLGRRMKGLASGLLGDEEV